MPHRSNDMKPPEPRWRSFPPFYEHLGLELETLADGKCTIRMPYAKHFGNTRGEMHGGIVASLLDITLSQALRSTFHSPADVATISMTLSYLAPAVGDLECQGEVVRAGRSVAFVEGTAVDQNGDSVCRAVATYRILRPR